MTDRIPQYGWRLTSLLTLCLALAMASGCSSRRSEQYRGEGDIYLNEGRVAEAKEAYQRAVDTRPDNAWAHLGLARCAAATGDVDGALAEYETTRTLDDALEDGYKEPVRLLVEHNRLAEALAAAEAYAVRSPEPGGLLVAAVLLKSERVPEAITRLESLRQEYPESAEVKLNLGVAYVEGGNVDGATALLKEVAHGDSNVAGAAQLALISAYEAAGKTAELLAEFEQLAAAHPEDPNVKIGHARSLLLAGQGEKAEAMAREILDTDPNSGWANYIVGASKLGQGNRDEALAFLESAAAALPENTEVARALEAARTGEPLTTADSTPEAAPADTTGGDRTWRDLWKEAGLRRLLDDRDAVLASGGVEAREILAAAALFMRNSGLAASLAAELPEDSKIRQFFTVLETRDASQIADFFDAWRPEEPDVLLLRDNLLGYAMAAGGSRGQALSVFLFCLERWPDNVVALFNIAQVFRAVRQPVIASQQLQRLIVQYPENIDAHQMLYASLREGAAYDDARKAAEATFTLFPEEQWSFLNLSQAYLDTGDAELALQVLSRGITLYPNDAELALAMAGVMIRMGDCAGTQKTLDGIITSAPTIIANRATMKAICAALEGNWPAVVAAAETADRAQWPESLALLVFAAQREAGDTAAANAALANSEQGAPPAVKLRQILLAASGEAQPDLSAEEQAWAATLGGDPALLRDYASLNALQRASLHDAAWTFYQTHLATRPPHIGLAQLALATLARCGNVEDVKAEGTAIAESLKDDSRVWLGLSEMLRETGNPAGQGEAIARAIEVGPENPEVWYRHAILLEQQGDFEGAVTSYRKLLELQPDSPIANNNLAYMLLQTGGHDAEALEKAALAKDKMPTNPGILHTLGRAQMKTGDLENSKKTLTMATEIDPANPTIMFDYGRVLLDLGDKAEAKKRIQYALGMSKRAGIEFPELDEAESLLATIE